MAESDMCLFLTLPWDGMQCVILVFPAFPHFIYYYRNISLLEVNSNNEVSIAIADLSLVAYIKLAQPLASHTHAGDHLIYAVEHSHVTGIRFVLHPLLISCIYEYGMMARAFKQLFIHVYLLTRFLPYCYCL